MSQPKLFSILSSLVFICYFSCTLQGLASDLGTVSSSDELIEELKRYLVPDLNENIQAELKAIPEEKKEDLPTVLNTIKAANIGLEGEFEKDLLISLARHIDPEFQVQDELGDYLYSVPLFCDAAKAAMNTLLPGFKIDFLHSEQVVQRYWKEKGRPKAQYYSENGCLVFPSQPFARIEFLYIRFSVQLYTRFLRETFAKVRRLDLIEIDLPHLKFLKYFPKLNILRLDGSKLEQFEGVNYCQELKSLCLVRHFTPEHFQKVPKSLERLHLLNMTLDCLTCLRYCPQILELTLQGCQLKSLAGIQNCRKLKTLNLRQSSFPFEELRMVSKTCSLADMRGVNLQNKKDSLKYLVGFHTLRLSIEDVGIGKQLLFVFSDYRGYSEKLRYINIYNRADEHSLILTRFRLSTTFRSNDVPSSSSGNKTRIKGPEMLQKNCKRYPNVSATVYTHKKDESVHYLHVEQLPDVNQSGQDIALEELGTDKEEKKAVANVRKRLDALVATEVFPLQCLYLPQNGYKEAVSDLIPLVTRFENCRAIHFYDQEGNINKTHQLKQASILSGKR